MDTKVRTTRQRVLDVLVWPLVVAVSKPGELQFWRT